MLKIRTPVQVEIPAMCSECGAIFNTHRGFFRNPVIDLNGKIYEVLGSEQEIVALKGTINCPVCKSTANFRCDLFEFVDSVFNDLKNLGKPEILYVKELLQEYNKSKTKESFEEIKSKAEKKRIFIFGKVVSDNIAEITALLALLGIVVSVILSKLESNKPDQVFIENIYQQGLDQNINHSFENISSPTRNRPCPCGSGKKYKHCCGKK